MSPPLSPITDSLAPVRYGFTCPNGPPARWHVRRFSLREALSTPYRLELELSSETPVLPLGDLLGASCTLDIERLGSGRRVHGVVHRLDELGAVAGRPRVRLEIVPALSLLALQRNTRFWQQKSAPQILRDVLKAPLAAFGRELRFQLDDAAYRPREYCVQYRETDLEFAARLMHEEGIVYAFDHDGDAERLVLLATTAHATDLDLPPVPFIPRGTGAAVAQSIDSLEWSSRLGTTSVVQRDWNWQDPAQTPYQRQRRGLDDRDRDRERYDHDDRRLHADDGEQRARHKLEAEVGPTRVGLGTSDVVELLPGRCFAVVHHPDLERDGRYLLTAASHTGEAPEETLYSESRVEAPRYRNEFRCTRPDVPHREPQPPARPRVHGPHTAIVVGPAGEEVHTDEHGRIKVLFHWDRVSPPDDTASCWIRVAQTWAGPSWGGLFLPRVGMEVLVEFIDGDPDRPVVTGCVYNALFRPPYALPDNKTQSGIKTESSPGGGGFNEIRFEDAKGSEELFIHAQRDMTTKALRDGGCTIGRDSAASVGRDEKASVGNDRTASVGNNETISVGADQTTSVGANQSTSVGANQTLSVGAAQTTSVGADQTTSVGANQTISVTGNRTRDVTGNDTVTITGNETVTVVGTTAHTRTGAVTEDLLATRTVTVVGAATETFVADRTVHVGASQTHNVTATAKLSAVAIEQLCAALFKVESGLMIKMNALNTEIGAITISLNAAGAIQLTCGGSGIMIDPGGVTINGGTIKIAGGSVDVTGGVVKIN